MKTGEDRWATNLGREKHPDQLLHTNLHQKACLLQADSTSREKQPDPPLSARHNPYTCYPQLSIAGREKQPDLLLHICCHCKAYFSQVPSVEKQPDMPCAPTSHWSPLLPMSSWYKLGASHKHTHVHLPLLRSPHVAMQPKTRSNPTTMHQSHQGSLGVAAQGWRSSRSAPLPPEEPGFGETQLPNPLPYTAEEQPMWEGPGAPQLAYWKEPRKISK